MNFKRTQLGGKFALLLDGLGLLNGKAADNKTVQKQFWVQFKLVHFLCVKFLLVQFTLVLFLLVQKVKAKHHLH